MRAPEIRSRASAHGVICALILITWQHLRAAYLMSDVQTLYGSLVGNIADPSGTAVPGATVVVTNPETGFTRQARTDERGAYQFLNLLPGEPRRQHVQKEAPRVFVTESRSIYPP